MNVSNDSSKIKETFEPLYGRSLSSQELFSIEQNLTGFFRTLLKIDQRLKKEDYSRNV